MTPAVVFIIIWVIGAVIAGAFIGEAKGRAGVGVLLGFLLGWIGVLITAFLPPTYDVQVRKAREQMAIWQAAGQASPMAGPRPFVCDCGFQSPTMTEMKAHIKQMH